MTPERAKTGALPNVIVIGAAKCGTSALHYFLDLHPEIAMSAPKELNFFMDELDAGQSLVSEPGEIERFERGPRNWSKGVDWYRAHFDPRAPVRGESTPRYTAPWYPGVPERMASVVPETKLIMMVRDPLDRILSQYSHLVGEGKETREMSEVLAAPDNAYVVLSRYYARIEPFLEHFPSADILVVAQEDLRRRPEATMHTVYGFLGVDETFSSPKLGRQRQRSGGKGRRYRAAMRLLGMPGMGILYRLPPGAKWGIERIVYRSETREEARPSLEALPAGLAEQLSDDAARLRRFTGRDFPEWSV